MDQFGNKDLYDLGWSPNLEKRSPSTSYSPPQPDPGLSTNSVLQDSQVSSTVVSGDLSQPFFSGKTSPTDTASGWWQGVDPIDHLFKWTIGSPFSVIDFNVTRPGTLTINIPSSAGTDNALYITDASTGPYAALAVYRSVGTGSAIYADVTSPSGYGLDILNRSNTPAIHVVSNGSGPFVVPMQLENDTAVSTNYYKIANYRGGSAPAVSVNQWVGTTSPDGVLTGTSQGDILQSSDGNLYIYQSGTSWTKIGNTRTKGSFGGDGSDGALSITSGTTTIDCGGAVYVVKNYSSISITGTGKLAFSNPHVNGVVVVLKSQGNVTITSSATPGLDLTGIGAAGGAGGTQDTANQADQAGADGTNGLDILDTALHGGKGGPATTTSHGAGSAALSTGNSGIYEFYADAAIKLQKGIKWIVPGSGGGGGGGAQGTVQNASAGVGGTGGRGGGGLWLECGGSFNYTTSGGVSTAGSNGGNGMNGADAFTGNGGGGGGGSAGFCVILYNSLTASTTVTTNGGNGGNGGTGPNTLNCGGGSGGGGAGGYNGAGGNGGNGTATGTGNSGASGSNAAGSGAGSGGTGGAGSGANGGGGGAGGGGAGGYQLIALNTFFD